MRVVHVASSVTLKASGVSYSVSSLCRAVARTGAQVSLHVLAPPPEGDISPATLTAHASWSFPSRLGISPTMRRALEGEARSSEVMHTHSLWMMPNIYPSWAVEGTGCRLVTSPRGTVDPRLLRHHRWRKRAMWLAFQRRAARKADCYHATGESEFDGIRRLGLRAPVAVIPNGVDVPPAVPPPSGGGGRRRLLYVGRLHPTKGIDVLLRAWRDVQEDFLDWDLLIVGPSDFPGYLETLKGLAADLAVERVEFLGPLYGDEKSRAYRGSDLFVLPSRSENFGMTVAEALAHGVPAIVSRGAPWAEMEDRGCGWWVPPEQGPLGECLRGALALSRVELVASGARGRAWMEREFSWARVGMMMKETYRWLLGGGSPPGWVRREG